MKKKCKQIKNKFFFFFCCCKKRNLPYSIVNDYINENLTIDNYLDSQLKAGLKKFGEIQKKSKKR